MDMVEDSEEGDGDLVLEEALLPGLMLAWEEEAYQDAVISLVGLEECLPRRAIPFTVVLGLRLVMKEWPIRGLRHMIMPEDLLE